MSEDLIKALMERQHIPTEEPTDEIETEEVEVEEEVLNPSTDEVEDPGTETEESESDSEQLEETEEIQIDADVFAAALGLESDDIVIDEDDGNVLVRTKIDGKEATVNLAELRKGYQLESHVTQKSQKLADERRVFEEERQAQLNEIATSLGQVKQLTEFAEQQLLAEFNIDWQALRRDDPAEYSAKAMEFEKKRAAIAQAKQQVATQTQQITEEQVQRIRQDEYTKLIEKLPAWTDPAVAKAEDEQVTNYLVSMGYSPQEIMGVVDHRAILIAREAMMYRNQAEKVAVAKKKVVKVPKVMKPGKGVSKSERESEKAKQTKQRFKKTGSTRDLAAALLARRGS